MLNRRKFIGSSVFSGLALLAGRRLPPAPDTARVNGRPLVISTWKPNVKANAEAWKVLLKGGNSLDAVEAGVQVPEADPHDQSVGYGGLPDRDGKVTLDASVMDHQGNCGSVMFVEGLKHPVSLARRVMEQTPHIYLAGEGALQFALANGFHVERLLTPEAEAAWKEWLKESKYDPMTIPDLLQGKEPGQQHNHDTIGMLALDNSGNLSGACSTSGMAFKMHGRVGDSPMIGAGLYVDNEVGAATSTGVGEEAIRVCGAHTVVEYMRAGHTPETACRKTLERLVRMRGEKIRDLQLAFIAVNRAGEFGGYALQKGFNYAVQDANGPKTYDAPSIYR
ncbi:MAG TPA: N(4)-(beta-N-acetylglucosaminyl)-L-asparaginase [Chitinophagaceae bacterium]